MTTLARQERQEKLDRIRRAQQLHPIQWKRVRAACRWGAEDVDLDEQAAIVIEMVNGRRR